MENKINIKTDYPLGEKRKEWLKTPTGKTLDEINLENVLKGEINPQDIRISSETLRLQGEVAENANQPTIKRNFQRASELVRISDERILEIYNALRPNRSSKEELLKIADELEHDYNAIVNANFIREAAEIYEKRGKLRKNENCSRD